MSVVNVKKIFGYSLCAVLGASALYFGVCAAAAVGKILSQPHLESAAERFDFVGWYIIAAAYGVGCLIAIILLVLLTVRFVKRKKSACA